MTFALGFLSGFAVCAVIALLIIYRESLFDTPHLKEGFCPQCARWRQASYWRPGRCEVCGTNLLIDSGTH